LFSSFCPFSVTDFKLRDLFLMLFSPSIQGPPGSALFFPCCLYTAFGATIRHHSWGLILMRSDLLPPYLFLLFFTRPLLYLRMEVFHDLVSGLLPHVFLPQCLASPLFPPLCPYCVFPVPLELLDLPFFFLPESMVTDFAFGKQGTLGRSFLSMFSSFNRSPCFGAPFVVPP